MKINGKEYKFRERVVIGQLLKMERLQRQNEEIAKTVVLPGWKGKIKEYFVLRRMRRIWLQMCGIMFENADSGLSYLKLTAGEVQSIPENFFAFVEKMNDSNKTSHDSKAEGKTT